MSPASIIPAYESNPIHAFAFASGDDPAIAADRFARDPEQISIATTGRIVKIDAKNKTFKVRGSDGQSLSVRNVSQNVSQMMQGLKQHMGVTLPGGITIALPGRGKEPFKAVAGDEQQSRGIHCRRTRRYGFSGRQ